MGVGWAGPHPLQVQQQHARIEPLEPACCPNVGVRVGLPELPEVAEVVGRLGQAAGQHFCREELGEVVEEAAHVDGELQVNIQQDELPQAGGEGQVVVGQQVEQVLQILPAPNYGRLSWFPWRRHRGFAIGTHLAMDSLH